MNDHYPKGIYSPRKVIKAWGLSFNLGNILKYSSRYGRKNDDIGDLVKTIQYALYELNDEGFTLLFDDESTPDEQVVKAIHTDELI